jgi:hypothetical protein
VENGGHSRSRLTLWLTGAALATLAFSGGTAAQTMGNNSQPTSLDSAVRFLDRMARDKMFGLIVYYKENGQFAGHAQSVGMERLSTCTLRFRFLNDYFKNRPAQYVTRTIDFSIRREAYQERYNNVSDGITITGPVTMSDGSQEEGVNFGINGDLNEMSIKAFAYMINTCSKPYGFD